MFVVKVPGINNLEKTNGCEKAGNAILNSLKEIFSNEEGILINSKLLDLEEIHLDNSNIQLSNELIYKNSLEIFQEKPKTIFLGGDHSVSYSIVRAFSDYCNSENKSPCLIIFDSHADCIKSVNHPTSKGWLRKLIDNGFPAKNIFLVGIRNLYSEEIEFLKKNRIRTASMNQITEELQETCEIIMEFSNRKELYVSIDISVIDPVFAPGTRRLEPAGLTSREFIYLIQRINKVKNLKAIDLVEINPEKDRDNFTVKLGAKILGELL